MSGGTTMYPGIADRMQKEKERSWKRSKPFGLGQGVEFEEELEVTEGEEAGEVVVALADQERQQEGKEQEQRPRLPPRLLLSSRQGSKTRGFSQKLHREI